MRRRQGPRPTRPDLATPGNPEDHDPAAIGPPTDALDAYRREAMIEKRLKNAQTRRELINRAETEAALRDGINAMRQAGERLTRRFGNEAADIFNEAVAAFTEAAKAALAKPSKDAIPAQ